MIQVIAQLAITLINGRRTMAETAIRVMPLSAAERKRLGAVHPELKETPALVVSGSESLLASIRQWLQAVSREEERSEELLEVLTRGLSEIPDESRVVQLQRQAEARARYLREFPTYTSQQLARLSGSKARNESALASRWKSAGKVFAVQVDNVDRFPAFQFDEEFKPRPVIAGVLQAFGERKAWSVALWFASGSGWLGGERPVDFLDTRPDAVVEAARRSAEPVHA